MERDGDTSGGHISVTVDIGEAAFPREFELINKGIDDADIGLVGDDTLYVAEFHPSFF